jgi:hypothetical protein
MSRLGFPFAAVRPGLRGVGKASSKSSPELPLGALALANSASVGAMSRGSTAR